MTEFLNRKALELGDFVVCHAPGRYSVMGAEEFSRAYKEKG